MNRERLDATDNVSRFYGNPYDRMISPTTNRLAFVVPRNLIAEGENELRVRATSSAIELVYIDCGVPAKEIEGWV